MPKKIDLDFDDITSSKINITSKGEKKSTKQNKISNIPLSIPVDGNSTKFISKTISECSAKEFISWSSRVAYPLNSTIDFYAKEKNRVRQFIEILAFHKKNFIIANPNTYKTHH